jgi:alpha-amylase
VKAIQGYHYAYFLPKSLNTAYVDLASSIYNGEQKAVLTAVTATAGAQLVYTTDGSTPTASSTKVASGTAITIPMGTTTLKVGLLINNQVSGIVTREYEVKQPTTQEVVIPWWLCTVNAGETCAFFEAPVTWGNTVKCWAWIDGGANFTGGNWPGQECTYLGDAPNGNKVWKWTYTGTLTTKPAKIIFNNSGSPQTADLTFENAGYYTKDGYFGNVLTDIQTVKTDAPADGAIYSLDGRRVVNPRPGIYIRNNKKFIVK